MNVHMTYPSNPPKITQEIPRVAHLCILALIYSMGFRKNPSCHLNINTKVKSPAKECNHRK